jgi:GTPase
MAISHWRSSATSLAYACARFPRGVFAASLCGPQRRVRDIHGDAKPTSSSTTRKRRLDVAIVGLPNSGKSQLLNILTGATVSAVSRKRHTTREGVLGVRTVVGVEAVTQLLFVDTPGFLKTRDAKEEGLSRDLMVSARQEMVAVDFTVLVVDAARRFTSDIRPTIVELMMQAINSQGRMENDDLEDDENDDDGGESETGSDTTDTDNDTLSEPFLPLQKFAVVLNKVDLVHPKSYLLELAMEIGSIAQECLKYSTKSRSTEQMVSDQSDDPSIDVGELLETMPTFFYTSALKDEGVDDLLDFLLKKATPSKVFEAEPGQSTTMQPEERAQEIIREKLYRCLHKEVPHCIRQKNRLFQVIQNGSSNEKRDYTLLIQQDLIVQSKSHQDLVHGRGDQTLQRIRESAERDMIKAFGCNVKLHLHVKLAKSKQRPWSVG